MSDLGIGATCAGELWHLQVHYQHVASHAHKYIALSLWDLRSMAAD